MIIIAGADLSHDYISFCKCFFLLFVKSQNRGVLSFLWRSTSCVAQCAICNKGLKDFQEEIMGFLNLAIMLKCGKWKYWAGV